MEECQQDEMRPTLNFNIMHHGLDYGDIPQKKMRTPRDPMSHRIIEKRRRDRMNNCLADLSQLIPSRVIKQGQGRIEKTEIIEMATRHICNLQNQVKVLRRQLSSKGEPPTEDLHADLAPPDHCCHIHFSLGFKVCRDEVMKFLVERQGHNALDPLCVNLLHHLQEQLIRTKKANLKTTQQGCPDTEVEYHSSGEQMAPSNTTATQHHHQVDTSGNPRPESSPATLPKVGGSVEPDAQNGSIQNMSTPSLQDLDKNLKTLLSGSIDEKRQLWLEEMGSDGQESQSNMSLVGGWGMRGDCFASIGSGSSSGQTEVTVGNEPTSPSRSNQSYKFKNDIKLRFSADMLVGKPEQQGSGDMPCSLREDSDPGTSTGQGACSARGAHITGSDTTSYPGSDFSSASNPVSSGSNGSNGNGSSSSLLIDSNMPHEHMDLTNSVPGFALHPAGTYYIPIITSASQLVPFLQDYRLSGFCHPISIPVNFGGPLVSMQNIHVARSPLDSEQKFKSEQSYSSCSRRKKNNPYSSSHQVGRSTGVK